MAMVHYTPTAAQDLYDCSEFISRESPAAAFRLIEKIEATCALLAKNPGMGEVYQAKMGECRLFTVQRYAIFYRYVNSGIQVLRIVRGERDFGNL